MSYVYVLYMTLKFVLIDAEHAFMHLVLFHKTKTKSLFFRFYLDFNCVLFYGMFWRGCMLGRCSHNIMEKRFHFDKAG